MNRRVSVPLWLVGLVVIVVGLDAITLALRGLAWLLRHLL